MRSVVSAFLIGVVLAAASTESGAQADTAALRRWLTDIASDERRGRAIGTREHVAVVTMLAREARALGLTSLSAREDAQLRTGLWHEVVTSWPGLALAYRSLGRDDIRINPNASRTGPPPGPPLVELERHLLTGWDIAWVPAWYLGGGPVRLRLDTTRVVRGARLGDTTAVDSASTYHRIVVVEPPLAMRLDEALASPQMREWLRPYQWADAVAVVGIEQLPPSLLRTWVTPRWSRSPTPPPKITEIPPLMVLSSRAAVASLVHPDLLLKYQASIEASSPPVANLAFVLEGSDPTLRNEFVVLSAPSDHLGTTAGADSIFNGADDGGSGAVALLGVARQLMQGPRPARSVLFVWHAATEAGLLGSEVLLEDTLFPRARVVAAINVERLGRGGDTLYAVGADANFANLVDGYAARAGVPLDWSWNRDDDPLQRACRSDHVNYARAGIAAVTINSGVHEDWRRVSDTVEKIDFARFARRVEWVAGLVREVSGTRGTRGTGSTGNCD